MLVRTIIRIVWLFSVWRGGSGAVAGGVVDGVDGAGVAGDAVVDDCGGRRNSCCDVAHVGTQCPASSFPPARCAESGVRLRVKRMAAEIASRRSTAVFIVMTPEHTLRGHSTGTVTVDCPRSRYSGRNPV